MSTLTISNLNDGTTTVPTTYITDGSAKAYAMCNNAGDAIIGTSMNVSSITDVTTGKREFNLTSAMSATLNPSVGGNQAGNIGTVYTAFHPNASTLRLYLTNSSHVYADYDGTAVALGDLA
tara:strand:- start:39 stop:401 length:363 start_codon:yes stop_codon:yes gene_type:complete